jgi:hypothetical protein
MAIQQHSQQPNSAQQYEHGRKRPPWTRWVIAGIALLLIAVGTVIWLVTYQSSWTAILPIVILLLLALI